MSLRTLRDLRVLELSTGIAGGYAGKLFADAGADVVKVEPPDGDPLRRYSGSEGEPGALFEFLAAGKRSVTEVADLLDTADLVVVDRPPTAEERADPSRVVLSITPFGATGPWVARPATEFTVQAECGSLGARGEKWHQPVQAGGRIAEWVSGAYGAASGLAAVTSARRTGRGAHIDVSMAEVMCISTGLFTDLMMSLMDRPPLPQPPRVVEFPSIEPTKDAWVGFNTNAAQMFSDLMILIGHEEFANQTMIRMDPTRQPELKAALQAWTTQLTTDEVIEQASLFRIPVAPVGNGENLPRHEHLTARRVFIPAPSGRFTQPRTPYSVNGEWPSRTAPAPGLGEHNGTVEARLRSTAIAEAGGLPMEGLKVLDLTCWWAGPAATALFGNLGAEVIHVESTQRIDGMRPAAAGYFMSLPQWWERSGFFLDINVNKKGITLNLADPRGLALAKQLIGWADLVVENYTPRVMDGFGLDWDAVHAINPRAVMVRMPAYGLDGPWRDRVGFAQTMEAMSGLAWVTGLPGGPPMLPRGPCDPNGAMHAAFAMQVALIEAAERGEGVLVEAPLIESALNLAAEQVVEFSATGALLTRRANRTAGFAPQGVYPCLGEERWLAVSVATDDQWVGLRSALGDPSWAVAPDLDSYPGRRDAADRLDEGIAAWAAEQDLPAAVETLIAHGVPAGEVTDFRSISSHPLFQARGFFETCEHPVAGTHPMPGLPLKWEGIDRWIRTPAPTLGEHNAEVLRGLLKVSDAELEALTAEQVIGDWPAGVDR